MARSPLIFANLVEARIATGRRWSILPARSRMKKIGLILFAGFLAFSPSARIWAQSDDPSELFLKAYMTSQQGEKLEHENQFKEALAKYRFAGSLLEELRKKQPDWQPAIVDYRSRKVSESILRVQDKAGTQSDLAAGQTPLPGSAPVLPDQSGPVEPNVEIITPPANEVPVVEAPAPRAPVPVVQATPESTPNDAAIRTATKKLQGKVDQLQTELRNRANSLPRRRKRRNR